jgi:hypothetical protein
MNEEMNETAVEPAPKKVQPKGKPRTAAARGARALKQRYRARGSKGGLRAFARVAAENGDEVAIRWLKNKKRPA